MPSELLLTIFALAYQPSCIFSKSTCVTTNHSSPACSLPSTRIRGRLLDERQGSRTAKVCDNWHDSPGILTELDNVGPPCLNVAIETLSDDVLLEIFALCLNEDDFDPWYDPDDEYPYDAWYALAHVCQRWRYVVFASPRRLNLRLQCSSRRVREMLGVWPAFPIVIRDIVGFTPDEDNIIAALEHRDRVCEIKLERLTILQSEKLVPFMQESFPALTKLRIEAYHSISRGESAPVLPNSFLGGSAPHLRSLCLSSLSFPTLPNLLLSASHLIHLDLSGIPSGFISLEMVNALSALTKLEVMRLIFEYPDLDSHLEDPAPFPLTRSVLPALTWLGLEGDGEYLNDFVARIDVPSINFLEIAPTDRPFSVVDHFHLSQFIGRAENFNSLDYAAIELGYGGINVHVSMQTLTPGCGVLKLQVLHSSEGPLPTLVQACNSSLLPLSNTQRLDITTQYPDSHSRPKPDTGDTHWIDIFRLFSAAKSLSLGSMHIVPPVAFALKQVIEEGRSDVLPAIQKLSVSRSLPAGTVREAIEQFIIARGLTALEKPGFSEWRFDAQDANDE